MREEGVDVVEQMPLAIHRDVLALRESHEKRFAGDMRQRYRYVTPLELRISTLCLFFLSFLFSVS